MANIKLVLICLILSLSAILTICNNAYSNILEADEYIFITPLSCGCENTDYYKSPANNPNCIGIEGHWQYFWRSAADKGNTYEKYTSQGCFYDPPGGPMNTIDAVVYKWGGMDTPTLFTQRLAEGKGAGTHKVHGIVDWATGIDCSGFVCNIWNRRFNAGLPHISTDGLSNYSYRIPHWDARDYDIMLKPGHHVMLFEEWDDLTTLSAWIYDAYGDNIRKVSRRRVDYRYNYVGYLPYRYGKDTAGPAITNVHIEPNTNGDIDLLFTVSDTQCGAVRYLEIFIDGVSIHKYDGNRYYYPGDIWCKDGVKLPRDEQTSTYTRDMDFEWDGILNGEEIDNNPHKLTIKATDLSGNGVEVSKQITKYPYSQIIDPPPSAVVGGDTYVVKCLAQVAEGALIKLLEISTDAGNTWDNATDFVLDPEIGWIIQYNLDLTKFTSGNEITIISRVTDNEGHVEDPIGEGVTVTVNCPPEGTIEISGNGQVTQDMVTLILSVLNTCTDIKEVRISDDGVFDDEPWEKFERSIDNKMEKTWYLQHIAGEHTITAIFKDAYGNESEPVSTKVLLTEPEYDLVWQTQVEGQYSEYPSKISLDNSGNVYVAGRVLKPNGGFSDLVDVFLDKLSSDGNPAWSVTYELNYMTNITFGFDCDKAGNSYIATCNNVSKEEEINGVVYNRNRDDGLLLKYGPGGGEPSIQYLNSTLDSHLNSVFVSDSGEIYVAGHTDGVVGGQQNSGGLDVIISNGNLSNCRLLGTKYYDLPNAICSDGSGGAYIIGETAGNLLGPNAGGYDTFVISASNGSGIQFGTAMNDISIDAAVDSKGNLYILYEDYYLNKYDIINNKLLWKKKYEGMRCIAIDKNDNIFLGGEDTGATFLTGAIGKYNKDGELLWEHTYFMNYGARITDIDISDDGAVIATGATDTDPIGAYYEWDVIVLKMQDKIGPFCELTEPEKRTIKLGTNTFKGLAHDYFGVGIDNLEISTDRGENFTSISDIYKDGMSWAWNYEIDVTEGMLSTNNELFIQLRATDTAGNVNASGIYALQLDTAPPTVSINEPKSGLYITEMQYTVKGTATDGPDGLGVQKVEISTDGGSTWIEAVDVSNDETWSNWEYNWDTSTDGVYYIKSRAEDKAGNAKTSTSNIKVTVDNNPPTSSITDPTIGKIIGGDIYTIKGTASDGKGSGVEKVEVSLDGGDTWHEVAGTTSWTYTWILPNETGIYIIESRATDKTGKIQTSLYPVTVSVTTVSVISEIANLIEGMLLAGGNYCIMGTADSGGEIDIISVEVSTDGGNKWFSAEDTSDDGSWANWRYVWNIPQGTYNTYNIQTRATDTLGNKQDTNLGVTVFVDTVPPGSLISGPADGEEYKINSDIVISGVATDGAGSGLRTVQVSTDGGITWNAASGTSEWSYSWNPTSSGEFSIVSRAVDNAGNFGPDSPQVKVKLYEVHDNCASPKIISVPYDDRVKLKLASAPSVGVTSCEDAAHGVWYTYTAEETGKLKFSASGYGYNCVIAVYEGSCNNLNQIACSSGSSADVQIDAVEGTAYLIMAGSIEQDITVDLRLKAVYDYGIRASWINEFGSADADYAIGIDSDEYGNTVIAGNISNSLYGGQLYGGEDIFIAWHDSNGVMQRSRQVGSSKDDFAADVCFDMARFPYVVGSTYGSLDGTPNNLNASNAFIMRYDPSGTKLWVKQLAASYIINSSATCVAADNVAYSVVMGGMITGSIDGNPATYKGNGDGFIILYNFAGAKLWSRQIGTYGTDKVTGVTIDKAGYIYVAGIAGGLLEGVNMPYSPQYLFVIKYNPNGQRVWTKQIAASGNIDVKSITATWPNIVCITGSYRGSLGTLPVSQTEDVFVINMDWYSNILWSSAISSNGSGVDISGGIVADNYANIYVAGHTTGSFGTYISSGESDLFVSKLTPNGEVVWTWQKGSVAPDYSEGISVDYAGNLYITGYTQGDLINGGYNQGTDFDMFVAKINQPSEPVNSDPVIQALNNQVIDEGDNLIFTIEASDDDGDVLTYSANTLPQNATLEQSSGEFSFTPSYDVSDSSTNTVYEIIFEVSDGNGGVASTTIEITVLDVPGGTPIGHNVAVHPVDATTGDTPVTVTFDTVTVPGITRLTTTGRGPDHAGLRVGNPPTYYDITTSAQYSGMVEICVDYSGVSYGNESALGLFHFENGEWVEVTASINITNNVICGVASSLSPFAVLEKDVLSPVTSISIGEPKFAGATGTLYISSGTEIWLSAEDDLSGVAVSEYRIDGSDWSTIMPVAIQDEGAHTITYRSSDKAGNTEEPQAQDVTVDNTPPDISMPPDITVEATGPMTVADIGSATATDASGVELLNNDAPEAFQLGVNHIIWTATDNVGNMATSTQIVTVVDTTPPQVTAPTEVIAEATGMQTSVEIGMATATDAVGVVDIYNDAPSTFGLGITIVTWTAVDETGNEGIATQAVKVIDTVLPVVTAPNDIVVIASGPQTSVSIGEASATDAVGVVSITNDAPLAYTVGTTLVTWSAVDSSGNIGTAIQKITVTYNFSGFLPPVSLGKMFNLGSTVPVKFNLSYENGDTVPTAMATLTLQQLESGVPVGDVFVAQSSNSPDIGNVIRTTGDQYMFNLNTDNLSLGDWQLQVHMDDGTVQVAKMTLK